MQNKKYYFLTSALLLQFSAFNFVLADTTTSSTTITRTTLTTTTLISSPTLNATTSTTSLQAPQIPLLIQQITQAKQQLAWIKLNYALDPVYKTITNKKTKKKTKALSGYNLSSKDIALAVLNPSTNSIITTVGKQSGKSMIFSDPAVTIQLSNFNGVNSKFKIITPAGGTVLALKYLISGPESGSQNSIENALSESIYVPYSAGLQSPDVVAYGTTYLNSVIQQVTNQLHSLPSIAIPGKTITDAIPPAMIKSLVYAEHTNTAQILSGDPAPIQDSMNQLNIIFATNQGDAFKYSVSTAAARGIAQFIPSTYQSLVKRHPEASLIPDFVQGMADHVNSIKAMYLLLDDYAGDIRIKAQQGFAQGQVFDYAAASYNGGTTRVANAVNTYGSDWNADHSGQKNTLTSQVNSLTSQVTNYKKQIKKTSDKKTKATLQANLAATQTQLVNTTSQLTTLQAATLRNETLNYLNKIYKVVSVFNSEQA